MLNENELKYYWLLLAYFYSTKLKWWKKDIIIFTSYGPLINGVKQLREALSIF